MKNIAVFDAYHEFHFEVLKNLKDNFRWNYSYILSGSSKNFHGDTKTILSLRSEICSQDTVLTQIEDLLFPSSIIALENSDWYVDPKLLLEIKHIESLFLRLTDRSASLPISVNERRLYYLILINHFYIQLKDKKIDVLVCFDTPHSFVSIIAYELAKFFEIKAIRLEYHYLPDYSIVIDSYDMPRVPSEYLKTYEKKDVKDELPAEIINNLSPKNAYVDVYVKAGNKEIASYNLFSNLKLYLKYCSKYCTNIIQGVFPFLFKDEILHFTSLNEIHSKVRYRRSINKPLKNIIQLNLQYNKLASTPDLSQPFIYLGLHMQPEKTSLPMGAEFGNQFLIIKMISKSLPEGWKLYVKEHPNQFNLRKIPNANFRSKWFYEAIYSIKNIELIRLDFPSNKLIKKSKIVATITGTTGMEALILGKPVLCFGEAYYKACEAVYNVFKMQDLKEGIKNLSNLNAEEVELLLLKYLHYYYNKGYLVKAANSETKIKLSSIDRSQQIKNLSMAFNKIVT